MGTINHKGIPVQSSTYPEDWNPDSVSGYNNFMANVVVQNVENEGSASSLPPIRIHITSSVPVPVGQIIRSIVAASEEGQMSSLLHQASAILKGGSDVR